MSFSFDLFALAGMIGSAQGTLLAFALIYIQRGNRQANRILALFLLTLSFVLLVIVAHHSTSLFEWAHLIRVEAPFVFTFGPFLFLYIQSLTSDDARLHRKSLLHFAPFFLYILYLAPFYFQGEAGKITYCLAFLDGPPLAWHLDTILGLSHFLIYAGLTARKLKSVRESKAMWRVHSGIYLSWSRKLLLGFMGVWTAAILFYSYQENTILAHIPYVLIAAMVCYTGFKGLTQPEIFIGNGKAVRLTKYANSTLTENKSADILHRLQHTMQKEKPFLDSCMTLPTLARRLAVSSHHLSQIINEKLGRNFFEYVNSHRIEEAKQMLEDPESQNSNVADIALAVGFNSISAFNTAFKRHTRLTPSQFRNSL